MSRIHRYSEGFSTGGLDVGRSIGMKIGAGYCLALVVLLAIGTLAYRNIAGLVETSRWQTHSHEVLAHLELLLSTMQDAETGQRGYLITGEEPYLDPYNTGAASIAEELSDLRELTADNPNQQRRVDVLALMIEKKLAELEETIELRRSQGFAAALEVVKTDARKLVMDGLRGTLDEMVKEEMDLLAARDAAADASAGNTKLVIVLGVLFSTICLSWALPSPETSPGRSGRSQTWPSRSPRATWRLLWLPAMWPATTRWVGWPQLSSN